MKTGDVVRHKTGGQKMTVNRIYSHQALCYWFVGSDLRKDWYAVDSLKRVSWWEDVWPWMAGLGTGVAFAILVPPGIRYPVLAGLWAVWAIHAVRDWSAKRKESHK